MVQPAKNILRSYPAIGRQFMAMDAWARPRSTTRIRYPGSQARMWSSLIVVGNPLPQDRPQMLFEAGIVLTHLKREAGSGRRPHKSVHGLKVELDAINSQICHWIASKPALQYQARLY